MVNFFSPKETLDNYINSSERRINNRKRNLFLLAVFAGMFIGFGAAGSSLAVHNISEVGISRLVAGMVFPVGLMMVILTGAELVTGDCMFVMGACKKHYTFGKMIKVLLLIYAGNLTGGILLAAIIYYSGQFDYSAGMLGAYTIKVAAGKVALPFAKALLLGVLCNVLVCIAVFMAGCSKDIIGKLFCFFFPILLFVICGFEHCVANMYYIPAGILATGNETYVMAAIQQYGVLPEQIENLTWLHFFTRNLLPVTIGNIIGGVGFFSLPMLYIYRD